MIITMDTDAILDAARERLATFEGEVWTAQQGTDETRLLELAADAERHYRRCHAASAAVYAEEWDERDDPTRVRLRTHEDALTALAERFKALADTLIERVERVAPLRVLVATAATQGQQPWDTHEATEGELVIAFPPQCDDPTCPCRHLFYGVVIGKPTTTARVAERLLDRAVLVQHYAEALRTHGHTDDLRAKAEPLAAIIEKVATALPVGTVVERDDTIFTARDALPPLPPPFVETA